VKRGAWAIPVVVVAALGVAPGRSLASPGNLDPSFGSGGIVDRITPDEKDIVAGAPIAIQADGKIVIAAQDSGGDGSVLLERFTTSGQLDPSFGNGGVVLTDVGLSALPPALALQPDGDILVAGRSNNPENRPNAILLRYLPDGRLDPSFGAGGKTLEPSEGGGAAVAVQRDGRILMGTRGGSESAQVLRFNPNGALDSSFGIAGKATLPTSSMNSLTTQPDGRIVVACSRVVRLMPDGTLDQSFGDAGRAEMPGPAGGAYQAVVQADGKIAVAGYAAEPYEMRAWRLLPAGRGDPMFGSGGGVAIPATPSENPYNPPSNLALAVAVQPDGAVLATGMNYGGGYGEPTKLETVRLTPAGQLDPDFGDGGRVLTPLAHVANGIADSIALDGKGNVVIGAFGPGEGTGHIVLARYEAGAGAVGAPGGTGGEDPSGGATGAPASGGANAGGSPAHGGKGAVVLSVVTRRRQKRAAVRRHGLHVLVRASRKGSVVLHLRGLGAGRRALASETISVRPGRPRRVTLHPSRLSRRIVVRAGLLAGGRRVAGCSRTVRLR
jgi:uncharacterized delta-60 repeat protein